MSTLRFLVHTSCLLIVICISAGLSLRAQSWGGDRAGFQHGDFSLLAGAGIGMDYGFSPAATDLPAYMVIVDRGSIEVPIGTIGVGGILAHKAASQNLDGGLYTSAWSCFTAGARATFHVTPLSELLPAVDLYAGVMGGVQYWHFTDNYSEAIGVPHNDQGVRPVSAPFIGLKCSVTRAVGIWAEGGWDVAAIKGGVHVNF